MHRSLALVSLPCMARIACRIKGADFENFCGFAAEFCVANKLLLVKMRTCP